MTFKSDNTAGICPEILEKLAIVNQDTADAYGGDSITAYVKEQFNLLFEKQVEVHFMATGTATNCLALASLTPPATSAPAEAMPPAITNEYLKASHRPLVAIPIYYSLFN